MTISFVVPVFNTKSYLESCIQSLLNQGLEEGSYEIILINDGSTDGSEKVCKEFASKYRGIKVISQENKGLSEARNRGIRAASGDYLCFVDSDDNLVPEGIGSLLHYCNENHDLIRFWCELIYPGAPKNVHRGDGEVAFVGTGREYLCRFGLETFCCNYLYSRLFIDRSKLSFVPRIVGEDFSFMYEVMMANPRILAVSKYIYQYKINPHSISTNWSPKHSRRWVKDLMSSMTRIANQMECFRESDKDLYNSCKHSLDSKAISLFSRILSARYSVREFRDIISMCKTNGLIPLTTRYSAVISMLTVFPFLYPIVSSFFRRVFLPYIYPRINRYD